MRLGWAVTTDHLVPRTQAVRMLRAGIHSTLHGVVFAILCLGPVVWPKSIWTASRTRDRWCFAPTANRSSNACPETLPPHGSSKAQSSDANRGPKTLSFVAAKDVRQGNGSC